MVLVVIGVVLEAVVLIAGVTGEGIFSSAITIVVFARFCFVGVVGNGYRKINRGNRIAALA